MFKNCIDTENEFFIRVREVVNKYDLENLIEIGCPLDEYEAETIEIINRCNYRRDISSIVYGILSVFSYWFHNQKEVTYCDKDINAMAKELLNIFTSKV